MRKFLSRLFSSSSDQKSTSADVELSPELEEYRAQKQWEWERVGEQPYDHYTDAIEDVKQLKREKRHDEVEELLLWCIDYAEAEADVKDYVELPRAYYRHLAIVYRKDDRYDDEVAIIERYLENTVAPHQEMVDRLERAQELAESA